MERILDSDAAQAGGIFSAIGAFVMYVLEVLSDMSFNDYAQGILTVGGIVYLFYRIKNSRLDAKLKQRDLNNKEDEKEA